MNTIKQGSSDSATVKRWQTVLNVKSDGIFGPATTTATKLWQKAHGLKDDGVVGPNTWAKAQATPTPKTAVVQKAVATTNAATTAVSAIKTAPKPVAPVAKVTPIVLPPTVKPLPAPAASSTSTLRQGSTDTFNVKRWQAIIGVKSDGVFGPATTTGTKLWQKAHGLQDDGVVGPNTWAKALTLVTPTIKPTPAAVAAQTVAVTANAAVTAAAAIKPPKPAVTSLPSPITETITKTKKIVIERAAAVSERAAAVKAQAVARVKDAPLWQKIFGSVAVGLGSLIAYKAVLDPKRRA